MSATPPPPPPPPQGRPRPGGGGRDVVIAVVVGVVSALVAMVVTAVVVTITVRGGDGPEDVASAFLEESLALNVRLAGDPQRWCELGTERSRRELLEDSAAGDCAEFAAAREEELREQRARMAERCDAAAEVREGISWDIAITDVARAGGAARVGYAISYDFDGDVADLVTCEGSPDAFEQVEQGTLDLIREGGDWKVAA